MHDAMYHERHDRSAALFKVYYEACLDERNRFCRYAKWFGAKQYNGLLSRKQVVFRAKSIGNYALDIIYYEDVSIIPIHNATIDLHFKCYSKKLWKVKRNAKFRRRSDMKRTQMTTRKFLKTCMYSKELQDLLDWDQCCSIHLFVLPQKRRWKYKAGLLHIGTLLSCPLAPLRQVEKWRGLVRATRPAEVSPVTLDCIYW